METALGARPPLRGSPASAVTSWPDWDPLAIELQAGRRPHSTVWRAHTGPI